MKNLIFMVLMIIVLPLITNSNPLSVSSPDGTIKINIRLTDKIYYNLEVDGTQVMWYSPVSLATREAGILGHSPVLLKSEVRTVSNTIETALGIRKTIPDNYNELILDFQGAYSLVFRVYNDGIAYRWKTNLKTTLTVTGEETEYRFLDNYDIVAHVAGDFETSYEKLYTRMKIDQMKEEEFSSLPLVVDNGRLKLLITEADLVSYPGMYLTRIGNNNRFYIKGIFPAYPKSWKPGGWCQFNLRVTGREDFIARTTGTRDFPWRAIVVARKDIELADNNLVYKLARPSAFDASWVKPGKVTWEWWNAWNLDDVDFETGINNKTYKYYISFASGNNIEYLIMDEGWSDQFDVLLPTPMLDMEHLTQYAHEKGVKIILWCVWHTIDRQMKEAFALFEKWGIAGIKVDFIDRDDQLAIEFYERIASEAAKHHLLVDIHGCSKPAGLNRTYPNVVNFESVRGNEYNKFAKEETPGHNVDIVYTRMAVGPMDYTPGAMRNSIQGEFFTSNMNPMSHGTRCHQLAMYVVYFAPLQMLCDAPTAYENYPDILKFLSGVPTTWDETRAIDGKLGQYIVLARKKDNIWYIGGMTDWNERAVDIDLSFLENSVYRAEIFMDGVNANKVASDYRFDSKKVKQGEKISLTMRKGGGFVMKLIPELP